MSRTISEIVIDNDGTVRAIYGDALAPFLASLGEVRTARASHVEPTSGGGWGADMSPVGGPVLGPFTLRQEALDAEHAWLVEHGIPEPKRS